MSNNGSSKVIEYGTAFDGSYKCTTSYHSAIVTVVLSCIVTFETLDVGEYRDLEIYGAPE